MGNDNLIQLRLPSDLKDSINEEASENGVSTSGMIRMVLIAYLKGKSRQESLSLGVSDGDR